MACADRSSGVFVLSVGCLSAAKVAGLVVGIAGNQPAGVVAQVQDLGFEADLLASSAEWGIAKPAGEFFNRLVRATGVAAHEVLYVGDRLDNDILPAAAIGLRAALLRRGPWGHIHAYSPAPRSSHNARSSELFSRA